MRIYHQVLARSPICRKVTWPVANRSSAFFYIILKYRNFQMKKYIIFLSKMRNDFLSFEDYSITFLMYCLWGRLANGSEGFCSLPYNSMSSETSEPLVNSVANIWRLRQKTLCYISEPCNFMIILWMKIRCDHKAKGMTHVVAIDSFYFEDCLVVLLFSYVLCSFNNDL